MMLALAQEHEHEQELLRSAAAAAVEARGCCCLVAVEHTGFGTGRRAVAGKTTRLYARSANSCRILIAVLGAGGAAALANSLVHSGTADRDCRLPSAAAAAAVASEPTVGE